MKMRFKKNILRFFNFIRDMLGKLKRRNLERRIIFEVVPLKILILICTENLWYLLKNNCGIILGIRENVRGKE